MEILSDSSFARTHAQSRAELESCRAPGPYAARCELVPGSALHSVALQLTPRRFLAVFGPRHRQP